MKEKILILEDEIGIRSFVSINLKREGYEIIEAGTGQEAIEKIKLNTRHYAKRQITFFKKMPNLQYLTPDDPKILAKRIVDNL